MRVSTAFNRLLRLPGASVIDVSFSGEGVVVTVRLRRRRRVCSRCGQTGRLAIHDRRVKRWRHLDLGASRCVIECELRRLWCRSCGAQLEAVPWARAGSRYTRDFEDVVAWLAQQMAKTPIAGLLRIGWDTVGRIVERVIADHLDEARLQGLVCIGVDEISYRRHHRYLTSVVDHRTGAIVWCAAGPQRRHPAALLRRARRPQDLDQGGLDRHERRLREGDPRQRPRRRDRVRSVPRRAARPTRGRPGPPRRMERARALAHPEGSLDQGHPLVAAQGARQAIDPAARAARRSRARQQGALPRLPAQGGAPAALPAPRPHARARAPGRLAGLGDPLPAAPVRAPRAHDPPPPRRHLGRHPPRAHQRTPRGPQQPASSPRRPPRTPSTRPRSPRMPSVRRRSRPRPSGPRRSRTAASGSPTFPPAPAARCRARRDPPVPAATPGRKAQRGRQRRPSAIAETRSPDRTTS